MKRFYQKHKQTFSHFDGFLLQNTVLGQGLVIAPVIVAGNTMKNAVTLSIAFVAITFLTVFFSSFIPKRFPYTIRAILHVVLAALIFIPTAYFLQMFFPEGVYKAGVFLPLLVTNSLIVSRGRARFFKKPLGQMTVDLLSHTLGFCLVACAVGALREILGNGSFWGHPLGMSETAPALMFPFAGFILLGLLAAALQKFRNYLTQTGSEPGRFSSQPAQKPEASPEIASEIVPEIVPEVPEEIPPENL